MVKTPFKKSLKNQKARIGGRRSIKREGLMSTGLERYSGIHALALGRKVKHASFALLTAVT